MDKNTLNIIFSPLDSAGKQAQYYLYNIYATVKNGNNRVSSDFLDAASDDAVSSQTSATTPIKLISTGAYNSATLPTAEDVWQGTTTNNGNTPIAYTGNADSYWAGIRTANEFIANIGVVPVKGSTNGIGTRYIWRNEARFLRAYFYFELVKRYGGVPLLGNKVYNITDNLNLPRNSFADCISYIVSECNAIKDSLITYPLANPSADNFRVTKGAALTLKAKALLYAASPLFNGSNIDPANPLTGYTNYDVNRWTLAANAFSDVVNLGTYKLDPSYTDIFLTQNNSERIFIRPNDIGTQNEKTNGPIGIQPAAAAGNTSPTQEFVNAFPMINGLAITDPTSGYNASDPYSLLNTTKRDPRFDANLIYNGGSWLNTTIQTYEGGVNKPNINTQQTVTSYYTSKFMGVDQKIAPPYPSHSEDWIVFRYAEVLLGLAEAENEAAGTPPSDCYTQIYAIRARAGIKPGTGNTYGVPQGMTTAQMRAFIQNEWRIEFFLEEHRYFDIRRWRLAETVMNQPRTGLSIAKIGTTTIYNPINVLTTVFATKQYLYPIPLNEVLKNPNMKQNPGW
ncbi:RagB/SusD family nutrient uptake outer membrane protein [Mucilaginibacter sp.]|uniref:RagB/SusD family nutrient uptake outer membrane protein n=1 Tax=Mucilaginibacter sp. TaxID=1882438 RepID=UPI00261B8AA6|nr:RagB/SusD family nutrient uptake outer membrane protein [Mucilaginibacter sp.]